jgi:hypothetical protein
MKALEQPVPSARSSRLLYWGHVRKFAVAVGADMEDYLANEDVILVERITPQFVDRDDGGVDVRATAPAVSPDDFHRALQAQPVGEVMNLRQGGERRRRMVLDPDAQKALSQVAEKPVYTPNEAVLLAASPEKFFDPSLFDLSQYSERVTGFGPRRYRANVVVQNSDGNTWFRDGEAPTDIWLDLFDERDAAAEPARVDLTDDATRERVQQVVEEAWDGGHAYAEVEERWVRITPELRAVLSDLPETLAKPEDEVTGPEVVRPPELADMVLQIEDNVERLGFGQRATLPRVPESFTPPWPSRMASAFGPKPHQRTGFRTLAWWASSDSTPIQGGLIADDMGLGKTFQVIALMARLAEEQQLRPSLVIAPASLLVNWEQEARRFAPQAIRNVRHLKDVPRGREAALLDADLVLTSYESLAQRDIEVGRVPWKLVVCDEAQKIKNPSTRVAHAAKGMHAKIRLAITGTPVENSLEDLWSITDFFQPGLLGSLTEFKRAHDRSVIHDDGLRSEASETLRATLEPVMVRRMKRDAGLDLPSIQVETLECPMSETQVALYARVREVRTGGQGAALAAITRMLQVCAWPGLVSPVLAGPSESLRTCPKLAKTLDLLEQIRHRGEKVLIFARWIELQIALADIVRQRFGVPVSVLNGTVPAERRQEVIDAFGSAPGFGVLVLAPRACGVGLNITAANHVIHYTREWNPAVEAQATDRVYRIGQTRPVRVYLPVATHPQMMSAEVILSQVIEGKEALRNDFIQPVEHAAVGIEDFVRAGAFAKQTSPLRVEDLQFADPERIATLLSGRNTRVEEELRPHEGRLFILSDGAARWVIRSSAPNAEWPERLGVSRQELVFTRPVGVFERARMVLKGWTIVAPEDAIRRLEGYGVLAEELLRPTDAKRPNS